MTKYALDKTNATLADYSHAGKTFTAGNMALSPKTKYLYHVVFKMNPFVLQGRDFKKEQVSALVKSADLPKFNIQTDSLNQYNRRKYTQIKVDYLPVSLKFHDDSAHIVAELWRKYFTYYYADSISAKQPILTYVRNAMSNESINSVLGGAARFGYDNGSYAKFFNSIEIYHMTRGNWYSYELINPIISAWSHDALDSSSSATAEQSMTLLYEAVAYKNGSGNPPGFGSGSYDVVASPTASLAKGNVDEQTTATVVGQSNDNTVSSIAQNTAYATNNPIITSAAPRSLSNTISAGVAASNATANISGIKNISFPNNEQSTAVIASPVTL